MKKTCNQCHAKDLVQEHFDASDEVVKPADHEFATAIGAVQALYKDGFVQKPEGGDFAPDLLRYEAPTKIEQELYLIFLEYR